LIESRIFEVSEVFHVVSSINRMVDTSAPSLDNIITNA